MTAGRKPNNEPATAWDKRRAILLVQVLAIESCILRGVAINSLAGEKSPGPNMTP